jgi:hypothetical protein
MRTLRRAVEDLLPDATALGGGRNIDRNRLLEVLTVLSGDLKRALRVRLAVSVVILCLSLAVVWSYADQPQFLAAGLAAVALTFAAAVAALKQVTDELAQLSFVRSLAPDVSLEALTEIARAIVLLR